MIPYGRQTIVTQDLQAVTDVLLSDWLTQGPKVTEFEEQLARQCDARHIQQAGERCASRNGRGMRRMQGRCMRWSLTVADSRSTPLTVIAFCLAVWIISSVQEYRARPCQSSHRDSKKF